MDRDLSVLAHILDENYEGSRGLCGERAPRVIVLRSLVDQVPLSYLCPRCRQLLPAENPSELQTEFR